MSYLIVSDLHFHNWSAFASVTSGGVNTRLQLLLDEVRRAAQIAIASGIKTMIVAGDVFHVRGQIAPSVLNPVRQLFRDIAQHMDIYILAGNHDLEGRDASWLGSAVSTLEQDGIKCISDEPYILDVGGVRIGLIPWIDDLERLKQTIERQAGVCNDLIIHAPINGVIKGIPDTGLDPDWLNSLNVDCIFSGHYHNHKQMGDKVYSIGSIAHHSWSDVGSKAGFIIVDEFAGPTFHATHCPEFVDFTPDMDESDMKLAADGNYVRARVTTSKAAEVQAIRKMLIDAGAVGVNIMSEPEPKGVAREATSVKKGMSLRESVAAFIDPTGTDPTKAAVRQLCEQILTEVESAA